MYGQMTAGSWIYIGTQGIVQGTYETFVEMGRQHYGGDLAGRWILTARPRRHGRRAAAGRDHGRRLAASRSNASRAASRCACAPAISTAQPTTLDEALAIIERSCREQEAGLGRPARQRRRDLPGDLSGAACGPMWSPTRPRRTIRQRLPAEGLDAGRVGEQARERSRRRSRRRRKRSMARARARHARLPEGRRADARLRQQHPPDGARRKASTNAFDFPGFVPAYIRPLFCRGIGPFRWAALSGDPEDIYRPTPR